MRTIRVTLKDIKNGTRGAPDRCPVTLAIKRALNIDGYIAVFGPSWRIGTYSDGGPERLLPKKVGQFVEHFDHHKPVKPFTFMLDMKGIQ